MCEDGVIEGVTAIRDETNKEGVRFVIELAKGVSSEPIIAKLFKNTRLEDTYSINQVALVDKKPRLLNLKQLLEIYNEHQRDVLIRKTNFDADKIKHKILFIFHQKTDAIIILYHFSQTSKRISLKLSTF